MYHYIILINTVTGITVSFFFKIGEKVTYFPKIDCKKMTNKYKKQEA